jgi:hypothetical protein
MSDREHGPGDPTGVSSAGNGHAAGGTAGGATGNGSAAGPGMGSAGNVASLAAHRRRKARALPPPEPAPDEDGPTLAERVREAAARGLDEEEIRAVLGLPSRLDARTERALAAAFRTGQLLGRARVKQAQFDAALQGRVTAQVQVLLRLGEPQGEEGGESEQADVEAIRPSPPHPEEER